MPDSLPREPQANTSSTGCLLRMVWLIGAPLAMVLTGAVIVMTRSPALSWRDGLFLCFLSAALGSRLLDVTRFGGTDSDGQPTPPAVLWRWMAVTGVLGSVGLVSAHALASWMPL